MAQSVEVPPWVVGKHQEVGGSALGEPAGEPQPRPGVPGARRECDVGREAGPVQGHDFVDDAAVLDTATGVGPGADPDAGFVRGPHHVRCPSVQVPHVPGVGRKTLGPVRDARKRVDVDESRDQRDARPCHPGEKRVV